MLCSYDDDSLTSSPVRQLAISIHHQAALLCFDSHDGVLP